MTIQGQKLRTERDAVEVIGDALGQGDSIVLIPVDCLDDDFFRLRTGVAGSFLQKFANYRIRVAIVGDISTWVAESDALRDFVVESNRGGQIQFIEKESDLKR